MEHKKWIETQKSDLGTYDYISRHEDEINLVKKKFFDDMDKFGPPKTAFSIFGPEDEGCDGYIEFVFYPEEGGTFTKIYGCSYLYKGVFPIEVVYGLQLSKHFFSEMPRDISRHFLLWIGLVLFFLFQRKSFLEFATEFMRNLNLKVTEHYEPHDKNKEGQPEFRPERYNNFEKEIERAILIAIRGEGLWEQLFIYLTRFLKLFLYSDNTYRLRLQDAFEEGKKSLVKVLDVLISRETPYSGVGPKWKFLKFALSMLCLISPAIKRISRKFMENLDKDKIKMDEADWYWCLKFRSYNFGGKSQEWRYAERDRLDKELHHIFLL